MLNGGADVESMPKKGLMGLPFMQKAMQKRKAEMEETAQKMLHEIDGTKETEDKIGKSRMQFGGEQTQKRAHSSDSEEDGAHRISEKLKKVAKKRLRDSEKASSSMTDQAISPEVSPVCEEWWWW